MTLKPRSSLALIAGFLFTLPFEVAAQVDPSGSAYKAGHSAGKLVGYLILALIVVAVIRKFLKK